MATEVKVPTTGNAGEPAVVLELNVAVGDQVSAGDVVATLETAKATVEVDTPVGGTVLDIRFQPGDEAPEHDVLMLVGEAGEIVTASAAPSAPADPSPSSTPASPPSPAASPTVEPAPERVADPSPAPRTRISISPRARRLAESSGIDIRELTGSGPFGRILFSDVEAAIAAAPAHVSTASRASAPDPTATETVARGRRVPVRGARKATAQHMHASLQNSAQVTLTRYASADAMLAYADRLKAAAERRGAVRIGINDLLLFAVARTVGRHPAANAWFEWDAITEFDHVDLGFAVDTGRALLVPVIRDADSLSLAALATAAHDAIDRARAGKTGPAELAGGTFTVSNLGGAGIHWFTPVLNAPQACILGVGAVHRVMPEAPALLPLSLTFDHRAIDGSAAAALLADIASAIEHVDTLAVY